MPNHSFETITQCPDDYRQVERFPPWMGTPQPAFYYHECFLSQGNNRRLVTLTLGEHKPRTGQAFAYLYSWVGSAAGVPFKRASYAAVPLKETLITGQPYFVEVAVDVDLTGQDDLFAKNPTFGIAFSPQPLQSVRDDEPIVFTPQVLLNIPYTKPADITWDLQSGCYVAKGGERYLTIGTFAGVSKNHQFALFIDDLKVIPQRLNLGPDTTLCEGQALILRARCPGARAWRWSDGSTDSTLTVRQTGAYWVSVRTDCATLSDTVRVEFRRSDLDLGPDTLLCAGTRRTLTAPEGASRYRWSTGSTEARISVDTPGLYWVEVQQNGCVKRDSIQFRPLSLPVVNLPGDTVRCEDDPLLVLQAGAADSYRWSTGETTAQIEVEQAGTYSVTATNPCGASQGQVRVRVEGCSCQIYMPTAFTPNGDGLNDQLLGWLTCDNGSPLSVSWEIYNRWGELVFRSADLTNGWDGRYRGQPAMSGMYHWRLVWQQTRQDKQRQYSTSGTISLLR